MDAATFKRRAYVGLVLMGACLVVAGLIGGAEWLMAAFAALGGL